MGIAEVNIMGSWLEVESDSYYFVKVWNGKRKVGIVSIGDST